MVARWRSFKEQKLRLWAVASPDRYWSASGLEARALARNRRQGAGKSGSVGAPPIAMTALWREELGGAHNSRARVVQTAGFFSLGLLVFGSVYPGAILVHLFEPQPNGPEEHSDSRGKNTDAEFETQSPLKETKMGGEFTYPLVLTHRQIGVAPPNFPNSLNCPNSPQFPKRQRHDRKAKYVVL